MKTDIMWMHSEVTAQIISAYYKVYNKLGFGFLEKVYENALVIELKKTGLIIETQKKIEVYYDDQEVGFYIADIIVNKNIIIEIKASSALHHEDEAQLLNYLKATNLELGLLFNFGKKPEFKRKIYENQFKNQFK